MMMLQRIEEHDGMIQTLSQTEDHDQHLPYVTAMLGLRGHMYGELIRIQMMLAKDDPQLEVRQSTVLCHPSLASCMLKSDNTPGPAATIGRWKLERRLSSINN